MCTTASHTWVMENHDKVVVRSTDTWSKGYAPQEQSKHITNLDVLYATAEDSLEACQNPLEMRQTLVKR
jgi:hypothetical protein